MTLKLNTITVVLGQWIGPYTSKHELVQSYQKIQEAIIEDNPTFQNIFNSMNLVSFKYSEYGAYSNIQGGFYTIDEITVE